MTQFPPRPCVAALACVALSIPVLATIATGEQNPPVGTVIDKANIDTFKDFFSPAVQWIVRRGAKINVAPYRKIELTPLVKEATEKYSAQVELSEDGTHVLNHVAGLPFPTVDPNEKFAATKVMYNFESAIEVDDLDLRNFDCDTGVIGRNGDPVRVERHFLIDHFRRMYFTGRLEVDPIPVLEPNKDEVRLKEALYPLIEPFDLKGVGFTSNRYIDHTRQDDSWLYLPQLRRVRRLSSAQRSDALFGQDTDQDSYAGYAGNVSWMNWKFLGEKKLLASMHSKHLPVKWSAPSADYMHDDGWEPRDVWVVEGRSKLPQYAFSKRVIFVDKETSLVAYSDMYDQAGELWKVWINNYKRGTKPIEEAKYEAPYERNFNPSITMVDIQLEHVTFCSLPSSRFEAEQGWYVNLGDKEGTTEEGFALSSIIKSGR